MLNLHEIRGPETLLLECISGSRAYGTETPDSDTDLRGIFILPRRLFLGSVYTPQVSDDKNDETYYEIGRYIELLSRSNPTVMELLFVSPDSIRHRDPILDLITPEIVLSKQCETTFSGYAISQIKRAHGLNKKIVNPIEGPRKTVLDFCYVVSGHGSLPIVDWLVSQGLHQRNCGLTKVPHMKDVYAIFYSENHTLRFKGIVGDENTNQVRTSSIPKDQTPIGWMTFNKDGYEKHCKEYLEYQNWLENRNESRYTTNMKHGKNYDSKHMMHTIRLLDSAYEIATEGRLNVRRPNRDFLLRIRNGEFEYDDLMSMANEKVEKTREAFAASSLPDLPDQERLEEILIHIRETRYLG